MLINEKFDCSNFWQLLIRVSRTRTWKSKRNIFSRDLNQAKWLHLIVNYQNFDWLCLRKCVEYSFTLKNLKFIFKQFVRQIENNDCDNFRDYCWDFDWVNIELKNIVIQIVDSSSFWTRNNMRWLVVIIHDFCKIRVD